MHIEHIKYLVEIAQAGSISAAAKKLYIGQTTLSSILKTVETELNVTIFNRRPKGVVLTPMGEKVISLAMDISSKHEQLLNLFQDGKVVINNVHLVLYPSACNYLSIHLVEKVQSLYKDVIITTHETPQDKVLPSVINGIANIGIGSIGRDKFNSENSLSKNHGLIIEHLYTDHFWLITNPNSKYANRESVNIDELVDEHLATAHYFPLNTNSHFRQVFQRIPKFSLFTNNEVIKKAVSENDMIAILPGLCLQNDIYIKKGLIKKILITGFSNDLVVYIVYPKASNLLSVVDKLIIQETRTYFENLPEDID